MKKEANSIPLISGGIRFFCNIVLLACLIFGSLYIYHNYTELNIELVSKIALTLLLVFALLWCSLFYLIKQKKISKDGIFLKVIYLSFRNLFYYHKNLNKYKESSKVDMNFCDTHNIIFFLPIFMFFGFVFLFIGTLIGILVFLIFYLLLVSYKLLLGHKIYDLGYRSFLIFLNSDDFQFPVEKDKYTKDLKILNFTFRLRPIYALLPLLLYIGISFIDNPFMSYILGFIYLILILLIVSAFICLPFMVLWGLYTVLKKQCLTYSLD